MSIMILRFVYFWMKKYKNKNFKNGIEYKQSTFRVLKLMWFNFIRSQYESFFFIIITSIYLQFRYMNMSTPWHVLGSFLVPFVFLHFIFIYKDIF